MQETSRFDGRVAIITGGSGGIGSSVAKIMAARGCRLVIADLNKSGAENLAHTLPDAIAVEVDLADEISIQAMIEATVSYFGRLDILHNNAAFLDPRSAHLDGSAETMDTAFWDRTYAINVRGPMIACRSALPHLVKTRGNIVNTVSNLALQGHIIQAAYSSSKAALIQLTRSIAASHGKVGVRCNAVAPGMTLTPSLLAVFPDALRQVVEGETLRSQLGEPDEIAEVVAFIASDAARHMTGQVLVADGGAASHVPGLAGFRAFMEGQ